MLCPYGHQGTVASILADVLRGAKSGFASKLRLGDTMVKD